MEHPGLSKSRCWGAASDVINNISSCWERYVVMHYQLTGVHWQCSVRGGRALPCRGLPNKAGGRTRFSGQQLALAPQPPVDHDHRERLLHQGL